MRSLISINYKFMGMNPKEIIRYIKNNSKYASGIEMYADCRNPTEVKYMKDIAFECKQNNFYFQVHANSAIPLPEQVKFFAEIENLYNLFGYKINVVLHPFLDVEETIKYINELYDTIDNNKITLSLENLNDVGKEERLNKRRVIPVIANSCDIYMTYDMGHEMADFGNVIDIEPSIFALVNNIHLHSHNNVFDGVGFDHKPIFNDDPYLGTVIKCIEFLKINKYEGPVVFEYNLYMCHGNTLEEQIKTYLESLDYISERLNSEIIR